MANLYVTQCPACQTRFQVSQEQLHTAEGMVRCGMCDEVFSAKGHLETAPPVPVEESAPSGPLSSIPDIPTESLQLHTKPVRSNPFSTVVWTLLSLMTLIGLAGQALWFERHQLAQEPALQPIYQGLCPYLDCQLEPRQDLLSIHSKRLLIRAHPKYRNALAIDLLIENSAPFDQPFPALQLVFGSLDGAPRAARTFQPRDYLAGDFSVDGLMPSGKPVQLKLDILEPGPGTPNYQLSFVPAEN